MRRELRDKWCDALESDEFAQTTHTLYNDRVDAYCCLGVLCSVAGIDQQIYSEFEDISELTYGEEYKDKVEILYNVLTDVEERTLVQMNDDGEADFKFISKWIRENIEVTD